MGVRSKQTQAYKVIDILLRLRISSGGGQNTTENNIKREILQMFSFPIKRHYPLHFPCHLLPFEDPFWAKGWINFQDEKCASSPVCDPLEWIKIPRLYVFPTVVQNQTEEEEEE